MRLNLNLLRVFYNVVKFQSFTLAAENLYTSQPAVSKGIKELEFQLGLTLITRKIVGSKKTLGIQLTEDGQALFEHARSIFSLEKVAIEDVQERRELRKGKLVIGASSTVASYWLAQYITCFHLAYPNIELEIKAGNTDFIKQALVDCKVDLAIVEGDVNDDCINKSIWREEELVIIVPTNLKSQPLELNKQLWLIREEGSGTRRVVDLIFKKLSVVADQRMIVASNEAIARMVALGVGISILPKCVVQDLVTLNKLAIYQSSSIELFSRPLFLLTLKSRPLTKLHESFLCSLNS